MTKTRCFTAVSSVTLASLALFAAPDTYDDLEQWRPDGGYNEFWATTNRSPVQVDSAVSAAGDLDSRRPVQASSALSGGFDGWWLTSGVSSETTVDANAPGIFIIIR